MKKKFLLFLLYFFLSSNSILLSQPNQEWVQLYNGPGNNYDAGYVIALDANENIYISGASIGNGTGFDYVTIKYNSQGTQQWVQRYNGPGNLNDVPTAIFIDGNGFIYVTGYSYNIANDYATIKYAPDGTVQWIQRYNGPVNSDDRAVGVVVSNGGDVFVTGSSIGSGTNYDITTVKYNSAGIQQTVLRYNDLSNASDIAAGISLNPLGGFYIAGTVYNGQNNDIFVIKYDFQGNSLWQATYNSITNGNDGASALAVDNSGNVYVTGYTTGVGTSHDYITIKYTGGSGALLWATPQNGLGNGNDEAKAIALDLLGNVCVTGFTMGNGTGYDIATCKYNNAGVLQWVQRYGSSINADEIGNAIAVDIAGSVYVAGVTNVYGEGNNYVAIKYNSAGVQNWVMSYNGPSNNTDSALGIAIAGSGNVYLTGTAFNGSQNYDISTIKYSQFVGIKNNGSERPDRYYLSQNYPNPFNSSTIINFQLPQEGFVKLALYDILGREVAVLANENKNSGTYDLQWDGGGFPAGTYFYKLTAGDYSVTKKLVLLK